eukprot:TRINITY_DN90026_c0_g1_i1.p1 TRINITY_DN90026_c0_g1~~TRINITY_DN90026_c0_g1_i1.p1  ORF type:complete len:385 (-),score=71.53 TRINITY_DN90026_c0_g1_i1:114-1139(-)
MLAHLPITVSCNNTEVSPFGCQIINTPDGPTMQFSVGMSIKVPVADIVKALAACQESLEAPGRGQAAAPKAVTKDAAASLGVSVPAAVTPAAGATSPPAPKWAEDQQKRSAPPGVVLPAEAQAQLAEKQGKPDLTPSSWLAPICQLQSTYAEYAWKNVWESEFPNKCTLSNKEALRDINFTSLPVPARKPLTHANFTHFMAKTETSAVSSSATPESVASEEAPARSGPAKVPPPAGAPPPPPGSNGNSGPPPKSSVKAAPAPKKVPPPTASVEASPPNKAPPSSSVPGSSPAVKTPPPKTAPPQSPASEKEVAAKAVAKAAEQASAATKPVSDPPKDCKQQ